MKQNGIESQRIAILLALFTLSLLTVAVYFPSLQASFVNWDDNLNIYNNPQFVGPQGVRWTAVVAQAIDGGYYIPLTNLLWAALFHFSFRQPNPAFLFHLTNIIVHIVNTALVFNLIRHLLSNSDLNRPSRFSLEEQNESRLQSTEKSRLIGSWFGAALFALHPLQVESVAWCSELKGLLSSFFLLTAFHFFISFTKKRRWSFYILTTVFYSAALLSKPSAVIFPVLTFFTTSWFFHTPWKQALRESLFWAVMAIPVVIATNIFLPMANATVVSPIWGRPFIASDALTFYVAKFFFPLNIGPHYARDPQWLLHHLNYLTWLPIPLLLITIAFFYRSKNRLQNLVQDPTNRFYLGSLFFFCLSLMPILGLMANTFQHYSTVADRYVYFPIVGLCLAFACFVNRHTRRQPISTWASSLIIIVFIAFRSHQQVKAWDNSESLWRSAVKANPNSWLGYNNLAMLMFAQEKYAESLNFNLKAIAINPQFDQAHNNLGVLYGQMGKIPEAARQFGIAVELSPRFPQARMNLANALVKLGKDEEAEKHYFILLQQGQQISDIYLRLGKISEKKENLKRALIYYGQATDLAPTSVEVRHDLARILTRLGLRDEAIVQWIELTRLNPNLVAAHVNAGALYYQKGDLQNARIYLAQGLQLNPKLTAVRDLLTKIEGY